jgi:erythromycin esterase-like protein
MAENVEWIHDHIAGNNPKMIIWAHDENIANDPSSEQKGKSLGNYLTAQYKNSYLPIGTTLYQGSFSTYSNDSGTTGTAQIITPLSPSPTYNYTLGQTDLPQYMLDLRKIPAGSVQTWASGPATLNSYGPGGAQAAIQCRLNTMFAVIINIQNSTPAYILHLS